MFKIVLERILKTINILINMTCAFFAAIYGFAKLLDGYSNEHDLYGIIIFVLGFIVINMADGFIRGNIKKF